MICPVYGDFYSFPWKRGPHDNVQDYLEASTHFEKLRFSVFNELKSTDFISKLIMVFTKEDELKNVEVKCSVIRMMIQMLRNHEQCVTTFIQSNNFKNWVLQVATGSKNVVL